MSDELPDLDPELVAALAAERSRPDLDRAHHDALWSRLETSLGGGTPDGGEGADDGAGPGGGGDVGGLVPSSAAVPRAPTSFVAWVASAFVVGVGAGALGYAALAPPETVERERVVVQVVERVVRVPDEPATVEAPAQSADTEVETDPAPAEPVAVEQRPTRPERTRDDGAALRAERSVVETARSALVRGDASTALAWAERHARTHPAGVMREEREVLAIQALAALGRNAEARARAARFAREFPGSLFAPTIREALRASND